MTKATDAFCNFANNPKNKTGHNLITFQTIGLGKRVQQRYKEMELS